MAEVKWIKIVTNIFDDEKIRYIETLPSGNEMIVIWFKILCLAGRSNSSGLLMMTDRIAYTDQMLSSIFSKDIKTIQLALSVFQNLEMIEMMENKIYLLNWEKHQSLDKLEAKKRYDREYQKIKRNEKLLENRTTIVRAEYDNRSLDIELDKDIDNRYKDKDKDKELDIESLNYNNNNIYNNSEKELKKPTLDEIQLYANSIKTEQPIDCERFYDHYESVGWYVGKAPMVDWKAMVRKWGKKQKSAKELEMEKYEIEKKEKKELTEDDKKELEEIRKEFELRQFKIKKTEIEKSINKETLNVENEFYDDDGNFILSKKTK